MEDFGWSKEQIEKGYDIFDFDGYGILHIEKIDDVEKFESDYDAMVQAMKDGIKIIPNNELDDAFIMDCGDGWIDTPDNRKALKEYIKKWYE